MNFEENEAIRQEFLDSTKCKLWSEGDWDDAGFSEEYVFWLEQNIIDLKEMLKEQ